MNRKPEVSVVMSVYNGASDLPLTLESILSQERVEFEFIVVNDGSTDKSSQILNEYAKRDSRLRIIHQENTGLTRALICGCNVARGEFIARQDAGDVSLPRRLKNQTALLRKYPDCVLVSCWTDMVGPRGEYLYTLRGTGAASSPIDILSSGSEWGVIDGPTSHPSTMFRAKQYFQCGGYRSEFYYGQDWDLWYRLSSLGTFCMLQEPLCICNVTLGSISAAEKAKQGRFARLSHKAWLSRQAGLSDRPFLEEARQLLSAVEKRANPRHGRAATNYFIGKCLLDNHNGAAFNYLLATVKEYPLHFGAWVNLMRSVFK